MYEKAKLSVEGDGFFAPILFVQGNNPNKKIFIVDMDNIFKSSSPLTYSLYNSGKDYQTYALYSGILGGSLIGYPIGEGLSTGIFTNTNYSMMGVGAGITAGSLILNNISVNKFKKAVIEYNDNLRKELKLE